MALGTSQAPTPVASSEPPDAGPRRYDFNFKDADLPDVVRAVSTITGKRFMVTGALPRVKLTIVSPELVTAEEAYRAFLTCLADNGLTVVHRGAVENIVTQASLLGK